MRYIDLNKGHPMYLNFFGRKWCGDDLESLFISIRGKYEIYALTLQYDKIKYPTFHERFITNIIIESGNDNMSFEVNGKLTRSQFLQFYDRYVEFKNTHPATLDCVPMHEAMKSDVEKTLGIDNNVNQEKNTKITFCWNDYTSKEREKMIAFLMNVDSNSPEVYIDIDLSSCTKEQAEHLSNTLICSTAVVSE